eukprot:jgi/Galph1/3194/GphlegSOOS_G1863.1
MHSCSSVDTRSDTCSLYYSRKPEQYCVNGWKRTWYGLKRDNCADGSTILRMMQWNILSPDLIDGFEGVDPTLLKPEYRQRLVLEEITAAKPDIMCLQEVKNGRGPLGIFDIEKQLEREGLLLGCYVPKRHGRDGIAIFYRSEKCSLSSSLTIPLFSTTQESQVACLCKLKWHLVTCTVPFSVVTTHLKAKTGNEGIRQRQVEILLDALKGTSGTIILCGDFNASAHEEAITKLQSSGFHSVYHELGISNLYSSSKQRQGENSIKLTDYIFVKDNDNLIYRGCLLPPSISSNSVVWIPRRDFPSDHWNLLMDWQGNGLRGKQVSLGFCWFSLVTKSYYSHCDGCKKSGFVNRQLFRGKTYRKSGSPRNWLLQPAVSVFLPENEQGDAGEKEASSEELPVTEKYETWENMKKQAFQLTTPWPILVEQLNSFYTPDYLKRLYYRNQPIQEFGAIFTLEGFLTNAFELELEAWNQVAQEYQLPPVTQDDLALTENMPAEMIVQRRFLWTDDWGEINKYVFRKAEIYYQLVTSPERLLLRPGIEHWLEQLRKYEVSVAIATKLDRRAWDALPESYKLLTDVWVTREEYENIQQELLLAASRIERAPRFCVVFDDSPSILVAAHDVTCKAVSLLGRYKAYDLRVADMIIREIEELKVGDITTLFGDVWKEEEIERIGG